jgi:hypothetical protein
MGGGVTCAAETSGLEKMHSVSRCIDSFTQSFPFQLRAGDSGRSFRWTIADLKDCPEAPSCPRTSFANCSSGFRDRPAFRHPVV